MFVRSSHVGAASVLILAFALCGCADSVDTTNWFARPLDLFGSRGGYTYANLGDTRMDHPITANDLVDANGACPRFVPSAPAQAAAEAGAAPGDAGALLSSGVAIGMSECEVVTHLGAASAVNLGRNPNGDRTAVLTFKGGPRPGVYRFTAGRLEEMDRVEGPPPAPEPAKKKVAKKKPPAPKPPPNT